MSNIFIYNFRGFYNEKTENDNAIHISAGILLDTKYGVKIEVRQEKRVPSTADGTRNAFTLI